MFGYDCSIERGFDCVQKWHKSRSQEKEVRKEEEETLVRNILVTDVALELKNDQWETLLQHFNKVSLSTIPCSSTDRPVVPPFHLQLGNYCACCFLRTSTMRATFSTPRRVTTCGLASTNSPIVKFLIHGSGFASKKGKPLRCNIIS